MEYQLSIDDIVGKNLGNYKIDERFKDLVEFKGDKAYVVYNSFKTFDYSEVDTLLKLSELSNKSVFAIMNQIVKFREYLFHADSVNGIVKDKSYYYFFEKYFGYSSTFVKNCLKVYKVFFVDYSHPYYMDFNFSQMVEMLPLSRQDMQAVMPDWSVRRIRTYKQELRERVKVADSKPVRKKSKDADDIEFLDTPEETISSAVKRSYLIDILVGAIESVKESCVYAKGTASYKIYCKSLMLLTERFYELIANDNTFID